MKNLPLIFVIFFSIGNAQTSYEFDVEHQYQVISNLNSQNDSIFTLFTNSENNDYFARAWNVNKRKAKLVFLDQNGVYAQKRISQELNNLSQFDCKSISRYENPYKYQINNYAFSTVGDTLINKANMKTVRLRCTNDEKRAKKKIGTLLYIIDPSIYHKPIFTFATAYEIYKHRGGFPDGTIVEIHHYDHEGKLETSTKLIKTKKVNQKLLLPNCAY